MAGRTGRTRLRPVTAAAALALAAVVLSQLSVASQSPSAEVASAAPGSVAPAASAVPVDVGAIAWKQSKKSKGFDADPYGAPIVDDMVVGPDGRFLLVGSLHDSFGGGQGGAIAWASDDGVRWSRLKGKTPTASAALAAAAVGDGFLIVGNSEYDKPMLLTVDGGKLRKSQAPQEGLPTGALYDLEMTPVGLVAAGEDADRRATTWLSTDGGTSWVGSTLPDALYVVEVEVLDDGTIVALGGQGTDMARTPTAWRSTDGLAWTAAPFPLEPGMHSVPSLASTPFGLVATVVTDSVNGSVWTSPDGVTWTKALEAPGRLTAGSAGTEALVFGDGTWWHSADGTNWTAVATKAFDGSRVESIAVRPDGALIAAGYKGDLGDSSVRTWVGAPAAP